MRKSAAVNMLRDFMLCSLVGVLVAVIFRTGTAFLFCVLVMPPVSLVFVSIREVIRSRDRPGLCRNCQYDLTGNVSGVCPECGSKIDKP